jgi:hypothetical protein
MQVSKGLETRDQNDETETPTCETEAKTETSTYETETTVFGLETKTMSRDLTSLVRGYPVDQGCLLTQLNLLHF